MENSQKKVLITRDEVNNFSILVLSCDRYCDLWPHFFYFFFKFWPDCPWNVFLGTNKKNFVDPRVITLQIGDDTSWADGAKKMVECLPTDYFLLLLEDFFIQNTVMTTMVLDCLIILRYLNGGYLRLRPFPKPDRKISTFPSIGLIYKDAPYRLALQAAIWKKSVFLKLIQTDETAWEMELLGSNRSNCIPEGFYCTWDAVIQYRAAITLGKWSPIGIKICDEEKLSIDFNMRPKMTREEITRSLLLEILNKFINIIPWKVRKSIKRLLFVH
jgi:hypothetical protein